MHTHTTSLCELYCVPPLSYILSMSAATKKGESHTVPTEARLNVKHNSRPAKRQRKSIWSHFTHGLWQHTEEEEEEDSGQ